MPFVFNHINNIRITTLHNLKICQRSQAIQAILIYFRLLIIMKMMCFLTIIFDSHNKTILLVCACRILCQGIVITQGNTSLIFSILRFDDPRVKLKISYSSDKALIFNTNVFFRLRPSTLSLIFSMGKQNIPLLMVCVCFTLYLDVRNVKKSVPIRPPHLIDQVISRSIAF